MKKIFCLLVSLCIAFSLSLSVSADSLKYFTEENGLNLIDDDLATYAYNRWRKVFSSDMTSNVIEFYSQYEIFCYYFSDDVDTISFSYDNDKHYYYSDVCLNAVYSSRCDADRQYASGSSTGLSGFLLYSPDSDVWILSGTADYSGSFTVSKYTFRDMRSTIKFLGIDGVSGDDVSGSLIVSTSDLTSSTFTLNIKNTTDTPYQAVVYTTQINNASADYAIKNDFANVFMSEATRYVAPKLFYSFCDAGVFDVVKWYKGVSGIFDFGMIVPDVKALFIKTVIQRSSYTGYDCTIYIPPNSTFAAEYDWSYIGDYKNDTDYYFNVVGLQLPETCERAFISYETGIGGSFDGYLNYYSHSFRFTDSEFKFVNPFQFIPTDKNTNNYDFSKEFENYLKTELNLTLDDFNLAVNNNTDINVNGTLISPITLFNDFKANIIASLGGIKAELGSLIDTVKLGYGGSNSYQNVINYSNNPYSYYDETTTETTINNNYDGSCNFHEDSFFNRFVKTLNYLFVPSDNYFSAWNDTFRETLNSKLPVANTLKNFSIDLHNALYDSWGSLDYDTVSQLPVQDGFGGNVLPPPPTTDTDVVTYASVNSTDTESIPKFTFTYKKKEYTIIDFTWYARYRDTIFNIINIIAYTFFFIHLFKSLPTIIAGVSSESGEHKYDN